MLKERAYTMKNAINCLSTLMDCGKQVSFLLFESRGNATYNEYSGWAKHFWHTRTLVNNALKLFNISKQFKVRYFCFSS